MAPPGVPAGSVKPPGFEQYFDYPASTFKLSTTASRGMIPLGLIATFSFIATISSVAYIAWRLIQSSRNPKDVPLYRNQLLLLIFNLLLADMFQAMSFIFSFHWYAIDKILAPTAPCWAQAWFLHLGDVSSGSFVMAIALHTWYKISRFGRSLSFRTFVCSVCGIWAFSVLVASLGPIIRGHDDFVRAGLWCWINVKYEDDRLSLHYIWIFIYECGTIIVYAFVWYKLYKHARECRALQMHQTVRSKIERSQKFMAVYPVIYVVFTLPLAFGRMYSMAHDGRGLPEAYMIVAGCLIASCGWMDALMYTITRGVFLSKKANGGSNTYSRSGTHPHHGTGQASNTGVRARDRINGFDDMTALRTIYGDDNDTPPEGTTTTVVVGGKDIEVQTNHHNVPSKSHRILGISRKTSISRPHLGRVEELVDDEKDLIGSSPPGPQHGHAGGNLNRISPTLSRIEGGGVGTFFSRSHSRAESPSGSDETRVPSNGSDGGVPPTQPASIPFGQIKKETTFTTTRSMA